MRICVIVPVLEESTLLPAAFAHLEALVDGDPQTEVVFVDGGSHDGTPESVRRAGFACMASAPGRGVQMNAGAAATRAEILLFLHVDTELPDGALAAIRRAIEAGAASGFFRARLDSHRGLLRLVGRMISWRSRLTGVATGDQAIFVTRAAFEATGGFAPLPLFEDVELTRRMKRHGRTACVPLTVTTSARRWEQAGPVRTVVRMWLLRAAYSLGVRPERLARYYAALR